MFLFCAHCNHPLEETYVYCLQCGQKVPEAINDEPLSNCDEHFDAGEESEPPSQILSDTQEEEDPLLAMKMLKSWRLLGLEILSLVPLVNIIALFIMAYRAKNPVLFYLARAKLFSMLIMTILLLFGALTVVWMIHQGILPPIPLGRW